ncbi:MAG: acyloxyacyl hydrolase [Acidobacteriota bacterium]
MPSVSRPLLLLLTLFVLLIAPAAVADDDAWSLSAGIFDIGNFRETGQGGLAYRFATRDVWGMDLRPFVGVEVNSYGGFWGYGGLRYEIGLGQRWHLVPNFAISLYDQGNDEGKDLGGVLEFRSAVDLEVSVGRAGRIGLSLSHLSNAGIYDFNPGTESLSLTYSFGR